MTQRDDEQTVAVFDFDGTLTKRNTTLAFVRFVAPTRYYMLMPALMPFLLLYAANLFSVDALNQLICTLFFRNKSKETISRAGEAFARTELLSYLNPQGMNKLREHKDLGHYCILATASYHVYAGPWACQQGFDQVISTDFAVDEQGCFTGFLSGKSCYGPEKATRLQPFLRKNGSVYVYGDSRGDKEMLELATHPFYRSF